MKKATVRPQDWGDAERLRQRFVEEANELQEEWDRANFEAFRERRRQERR